MNMHNMRSNRTFLTFPEIRILLSLYLGWVVIFGLARLGLLVRNHILASSVPWELLLKSFILGMRFDIAVSSFLLMPVAAWMLVPRLGWQFSPVSRRLFPPIFTLLWISPVLLSVAEWEFYREFHQRFNTLAIRYFFEDSATVLSMIWHGFPVVRYLIGVFLTGIMGYWLLHRLMEKAAFPEPFTWKIYLKRLPVYMLLVVLIVFGSRGGFQKGPPIRWGDAFFSHQTFANQLALNGIFTLVKAAEDYNRARSIRIWKTDLPQEEALKTTRSMILLPGDKLLLPEEYPLLRLLGQEDRRVEFTPRPRNVVLILMESLSAEFVHAMGAPWNTTPVLDGLISKGILFERFFSQGTHTHQGLYATMCSFPNLPGHEYLMQSNLGQQGIPSLSRLLKLQGYKTLYVYNGAFNWDNQEGFFRNQGMDIFVGRDDFKNPIFKDPTWGVSDEDVMRRAIKEIDKLAPETPVFALVQTLSNHEPFKLPSPAPFKDLEGPSNLVPRLNGIRYMDYALGVFFKEASQRPWFNQTLFVILGDHGFAYKAPESLLGLSSHHIPLVLYYPGDARYAGMRVNKVGSQVDVLPMVLGLLNMPVPNQAWGRDLLRLPESDQGWAVIKPSGDTKFVGYVFGDHFLVKPAEGPMDVYAYELNPVKVRRLGPKESGLDLQKRLVEVRSYVQVATHALEEGRAGVKQDHLTF